MAKSEIINNDALTVRVDTESVVDAVEQAFETTEEAFEKVVTITKNNPLIIAGVAVVAFGVGGFIAYKVAVKRTETKYEEILTEQIAAARSFHSRLAKEEFPTPESAVETLIPEDVVKAVTSYQGRTKVAYNRPETLADELEVEAVVETVEVVKNVFADAAQYAAEEDGWDYDTEMANRQEAPDSPYVVHLDEWSENEDNHEQVTLTYYAEDDTLADERDQPIDNPDYTVGEENLKKFGYGSKDSKVVYIRNEKLAMDFEVIKSNGSYHKEVLGLDTPDSLRHSSRHPNRIANRSTPRRFRGTDE